MSARKGSILGALILFGVFGALCYHDVTSPCLDPAYRRDRAAECQPFSVARFVSKAFARRETVPISPVPIPPEYRSALLLVTLVDSAPWQVEEGLDVSGTTWAVEVRSGGRVDTIPDIRVDELPMVVGDSVVLGFTVLQDQIIDGFEYSIASHQLVMVPIPSTQLGAWWVRPEISPDGRAVGTWALQSPGVGRVEILSWPEMRVVAYSAEQTVPGGDFDVGGVNWISPDTLGYMIWIDSSVMIRGKITAHGSATVDTVGPSSE